MRVNQRAKAADIQGMFWAPAPVRLDTLAQTRNYSGEFFEVATASLTHGTRLKTDGRADVCPDIRVADGLYVESKGAGKNGALLVYDGRVSKDQAWTLEHGATLLYCIWSHHANCLNCGDVRELRARLAHYLDEVILIPADLVYSFCTAEAKRVVNTKAPKRRQGFGGPGYRNGWNIRLSALKALCPVWVRGRAESFGEVMRPPVYCTPNYSGIIRV